MKKMVNIGKWNIRAIAFMLACLFVLQATNPMIVHATQVEDNNAGENSNNEGNNNNNDEGTNSQASKKSPDNSLSTLTLSVGELSPKFYYSTTQYTATVPYETTSVEVTAKPSHNKATVASITGNDDLQPGENTIKIIVKAENDAKAMYTIKVTREEAPAATEEPQTGENAGNGEGTGTGEVTGTDANGQSPEGIVAGVTDTPEVAVTNEQIEEYESRIASLEKMCQDLENKYKEAKSSAKKTTAIMGFIIIVLIIACINIVLFMKRRNQDMDDYYDEVDDDDFDDDYDDDMEDEFRSYKREPRMQERESRTAVREQRISDTTVRKTTPVKDTKDIEIIDFDEF